MPNMVVFLTEVNGFSLKNSVTHYFQNWRVPYGFHKKITWINIKCTINNHLLISKRENVYDFEANKLDDKFEISYPEFDYDYYNYFD